jgi:hypothetical protein
VLADACVARDAVAARDAVDAEDELVAVLDGAEGVNVVAADVVAGAVEADGMSCTDAAEVA